MIALLALGCSPPVAVLGDDDDGSVTGQTDPTTPNAVTYYQDVRPPLAASCGRCHQDGGLGTGNFLDYATAATWAEVMVDRIDAGEMPPPAADTDCHPYQHMDSMNVDPGLRDLLQQWIDDGTPAGDEATAAPYAPYEPPPLSRRDVELKAAGPVVPQFVDDNEYRCFIIDPGVSQDTWVSGIEFLIDNPRISHHALLFIDPDAGSESLVTDQPSQSWACPSVLPQPEWQMIHAWAPSGGALEFPDGMAFEVPKGSQLILQMHYFEGQTDPPPDQPGYALELADHVDQQLYYVALGPTDFRIPAGDPSYTSTYEVDMFWLTLGLVAYDVRGVLPHMHVLGSGYDFHVTEPDGSEKCISRADRYDFAMQPTYWFDQPVPAEPDDRLSISCTWDNSADNPRQLSDPPRDVRFGENTQDEMCYALMYVTARAPQ